ncbi:helix-turn-helix transcriptional regulator [Streptomyces sp. NPDC006798]|uniref:helix-turn-helix domain-containing protein n=1 Tax=Streptomyces sp. NPDC006798 TaxID=3155462 RepID=UPI0033CECEE4
MAKFDPRWLKAYRKLSGLSQRELAEAAGVYQPQVAKWESGQRTPAEHNVARLASALGRDPEDFLS